MTRLILINLVAALVLVALAFEGGWYLYAYTAAICCASAVLRCEWPAWLDRWLVRVLLG